MKDRVWFYIAIFSLITALVWVGVTAWSASHKKTEPEGIQEVVKPLSPSLDIEELKKIQMRSQGG